MQVSSLGLSSLISKTGSTPSPTYRVIVILVRALRIVLGTQVTEKGELYHPCLMLGIRKQRPSRPGPCVLSLADPQGQG